MTACLLAIAGCVDASPPAQNARNNNPATVPLRTNSAANRSAYPWQYAQIQSQNGAAQTSTAAFFPAAAPVAESVNGAYAVVPPVEQPAPAKTVEAPRPRAPAPQRISGVVILDAGHGGHDSGAEGFAQGVGTVREKDVNLAVALAVARDLRARGATVHLTRSDDRFLGLAERSRFANRHSGATFVSIHTNSTKTGQNRPGWMVSGVETYILHASVTDDYRARKAIEARHSGGVPASRMAGLTEHYNNVCRTERGKSDRLARLLQREMVDGLAEEDRGVKQKDLAVLRETLFNAAVLVEVGFLSHAPTAAKLSTPAHRERIARGLADGIARYLAGE